MGTRTKQAVIVLLILLLAEAAAYLKLASDGRAFSFFLQPQGLMEGTEEFQHVGYDRVDPLLGWGMSEGSYSKMGYRVENGMPVLVAIDSCLNDTLRILITGGSTSDLVFMRENWPVDLARLLNEKGICAKIHVGAVAGYSSGQELLRLLRDGLTVRPDIHISYSGANESYGPSFVSQYEMKVFERVMESRSTILLPNLVQVLREKLGWASGLNIHRASPVDVATFWAGNMETMNAVAQSREYVFRGILQPVLGVGSVQQPEEMKEWADIIGEYQAFYPDAEDYTKTRPYLVSMTSLFDTVDEAVYVDDCHLRPEMQPIVANAVSELIEGIIRAEPLKSDSTKNHAFRHTEATPFE
jgi:hypothetical protein